MGDSYWDLIQQKKGINEGLRQKTVAAFQGGGSPSIK